MWSFLSIQYLRSKLKERNSELKVLFNILLALGFYYGVCSVTSGYQTIQQTSALVGCCSKAISFSVSLPLLCIT